ncbi:hypothetical protein [Thiolapillus sp.]|uniref:hypothetical protein n=1 Tax=Thiolapillus sp. TaxID=2017437 RepID=UPI003AF62F69
MHAQIVGGEHPVFLVAGKQSFADGRCHQGFCCGDLQGAAGLDREYRLQGNPLCLKDDIGVVDDSYRGIAGDRDGAVAGDIHVVESLVSIQDDFGSGAGSGVSDVGRNRRGYMQDQPQQGCEY